MWLSPSFHCKLADWKALALQAASRTTHLAEIVCREPTHLGFCVMSGLGAVGVWFDPDRTGRNLVWRNPWPPNIIASLVSSTNPQGMITNSNLKLAALNLQEATLLEAVPKACMAAPRSGSDNTPTVSWSTCEASMINLVVEDILCIRALHSRKFFLNPSVFYHLGQENCMVNDASRLFYLSDTEFFTHMSAVHCQSHGSWEISLPAAGNNFLRDLNSAHETVRAGITQDSRQQRLSRQWVDFSAILSVNLTLQDLSIPHIELLQV